MTPPTSRTWSRRGSTPVIRVRGRSRRRFSIAALCCYKPGERSRLIYRPKRHTDHRSGGRKSFAWTEYRDLLIAAHHQPGSPIVLIWDNLNVHKDRRMRAFIDAIHRAARSQSSGVEASPARTPVSAPAMQPTRTRGRRSKGR
ncbi:hypothetical protein ABT391_03265 [Streptomyces jumonjinensis]|nr:hypothetical protein [Streptomyces jumonjinensis]